LILAAAIALIFLTIKNKGKTVLAESDKKEIKDSFSGNVKIISDSLSQSNDRTADLLKERLDALVSAMKERLDMMVVSMKENNETVNNSLEQMRRAQAEEFQRIRETLSQSIKTMQEGNEKKLAEIQSIVDEKLTKTLNDRFKDSFTLLTDQLEKVSVTIGEMKSISSDVGNLTKMLSGVKTAGIFGEVQLGSIIEQILSPEQYVKNVVTKELGREPVEYAVKMPGSSGEEVLMPIDSKFPYTVYNDMQSAYENNDMNEFDAKKKQLVQTVTNMAKDINEKYINPPRTTNFAVMFLPFEGLYAEIVKLGLVETLQSKFKVTVAGPTTMAALLNSLQMGFRTLAIQKKSGEVWNILGAVKNEFSKFNQILTSIQKKLTNTNNELDELIGTRTRAINRKLRDVEILDNSEDVLGITAGEDTIEEE
ncbi:MAG: DNA recombination protein RmuC, partial [Clostridia bacterium]|nr:DNA recombination protein RmuC [Clostridia bacterium]